MVGALPTTTMRNKFILILQDDLSKFFVRAAEAETVVKIFSNKIVTKYWNWY